MFLGTFYYIIDVRNHQKWCLPFVWIGTNALTIYMVTHIFGFDKLAKRLAGGDFKHFMDVMIAKGMGDMVLAIVEMALVFLFCRFLYNRKIFIRV
jgi:predicted acyltransferase